MWPQERKYFPKLLKGFPPLSVTQCSSYQLCLIVLTLWNHWHFLHPLILQDSMTCGWWSLQKICRRGLLNCRIILEISCSQYLAHRIINLWTFLQGLLISVKVRNKLAPRLQPAYIIGTDPSQLLQGGPDFTAWPLLWGGNRLHNKTAVIRGSLDYIRL